MFEFFTIVYNITFIVLLLTISLSLLLVFYPIKWEKRSMIIMGVHLLSIFALGTVLNWGFFMLSRHFTWLGGVHWQIAWFITIFLYLACFCKMYVPSRIIMGTTLFVTVIAMTNLGGEIIAAFDFAELSGLGNYLSYSLIIAFSFILRKFTLSNYSDIPLISVGLILVNGVISTWLVVNDIIVNLGSFEKEITSGLLLVGVYVFAVTSYLMVYFQCKANKEKLLLEIQNRLLKTDKEVLAISESALEEMRTIRHDIKNQFQVMQIMLEEEKYDELKQYFFSMNEQFKREMPTQFCACGNQLLDSILNMEIMKANSCGVHLFTKVNVAPMLNVDFSDLCRLMVNLLDNAMEGVIRAKAYELLVDCKIAQTENYLYICVQNAVVEHVNGDELLRMNTEKEDATRHGFGHRIVKRIVEKYNGSIQYTIEDGMFVARAMLDLQAI